MKDDRENQESDEEIFLRTSKDDGNEDITTNTFLRVGVSY